MEDTFDSTYIIHKEHYNNFMDEVSKVALTAYTIPVFTALELYRLIDVEIDIAMKVVWKPETTVREIKAFDKKWFLEKY